MTEIHLIPRDAASSRRGRSEGKAPTAASSENLNPLPRSVTHASIEEIDRIFLELQRIRDALYDESARLSRELARYASFNQSVLATMKVIRESLTPIASTNGNAPVSRD
jgi:hypothetical protein